MNMLFIISTIIMCIYTIIAISQNGKQRMFSLELKILFIYWISCISLIIIHSIDNSIGRGLGKYSTFDIFVNEQPLILGLWVVIEILLNIIVWVVPMFVLVATMINRIKS